jgi:hypothetical protein
VDWRSLIRDALLAHIVVVLVQKLARLGVDGVFETQFIHDHLFEHLGDRNLVGYLERTLPKVARQIARHVGDEGTGQ